MKNNLPLIFALLLFLGISFPLKSINDEVLKRKMELAAQSANWVEGYYSFTSGQKIQYNSIRGDVNSALLVRATNGDMSIEWKSASLPEDYNKQDVTLLWISGMDLNNGPNIFTLYVNNKPEIKFRNNNGDEWEVEGEHGTKLSFVVLKKDQNKDGFGYMWLTLPLEMFKSGEALDLKIVGAAEDSNGWVMVFDTPDALTYLKNEVENEGWLKMKIVKQKKSSVLEISAPSVWAGKELQFLSSGKTLGSGKLQVKGENSLTRFDIALSNDIQSKTYELLIDSKKRIVIPAVFQSGSDILLQTGSVINFQSQLLDQNTWLADISIYYRPQLVKSLKNVSDSPLSEGKIFLMNSSHQDIAWMDSPEKCVIERDTMLISPLLDKAILDKDYRFDIEDVLMVREYLERHPDKKGAIAKLLDAGKISVGASYIMPYEDMYSGESLIRQFYLGKRWLSQQFSGYQADTYWNVDVPGRTLQMPQILKKSGVTNMVISRHEMSIFDWYSPDGSFVRTFSPGHYGMAYPALNKDFFDAAFFLADYSNKWTSNLDLNSKPIVPLLSDWDMSPAKDYSNFIKEWGSLKSFTNQNGQDEPLKLPEISLSLTAGFFDQLPEQLSSDPIMGERPDVWLYIHGPSHQQALRASREADILLPVAEKFATIESLLNESFMLYPAGELEEAWEAKIFPDHGWGGKHGDITDELFRSKFEKAKFIADKIVQDAIHGISAHIAWESGKGIPLVVFNDLSWQRTSPVSFQISFEKGKAKAVKLLDSESIELPFQLSDVKNYSDGSIEEANVYFLAENVPSIGYKTFYIQLVKTEPHESTALEMKDNTFETMYYKITFGNGGLKQIYDKTLGVDLMKNDNLKAGEVFFLKSVGNGAGEFADIQQPDYNILERTGKFDTDWKLTEDGPVFSEFSLRTTLEHAVVEQNIKVFKQIKKIDFNTRLLNWDGILYREFREAFPLNQDKGKVAYEVPFGVVRVGEDEIKGAAGERYTGLCSEMHPRSILNWISSSDDKFGLTLSSSVIVWDYEDNFGQTENPLLQAILIASRKSCHGEGNDYLQTGNHDFSFSLTSHKPGWENGYKAGVAANHPFFVVLNPYQMAKPKLPEEQSFFSIDKENIMISTVKRSEDGDGFIIRWYETEGKDTEMNVNSYFKIQGAKALNLIEEELRDIPSMGALIPYNTSKYSIETIKILPK